MAQRAFQNDLDNSLTISGTIELDTGKYTCVATNGLDEAEASAQLVVQGQFRFRLGISGSFTPFVFTSGVSGHALL